MAIGAAVMGPRTYQVRRHDWLARRLRLHPTACARSEEEVSRPTKPVGRIPMSTTHDDTLGRDDRRTNHGRAAGERNVPVGTPSLLFLLLLRDDVPQ